jgi:hypothetical protein
MTPELSKLDSGVIQRHQDKIIALAIAMDRLC